MCNPIKLSSQELFDGDIEVETKDKVNSVVVINTLVRCRSKLTIFRVIVTFKATLIFWWFVCLLVVVSSHRVKNCPMDFSAGFRMTHVLQISFKNSNGWSGIFTVAK